MNLETNQLPPRRSRHTRPKASAGLKTWIRSGLLVFGVVFFGLIGLELYQANVAREKGEAVEMVLPTPEADQAKTAAAERETAAKEPTSAGHRAPSAQNAQTTGQAEGAAAAASSPAASSAQASASTVEAPKAVSKSVESKPAHAKPAGAPAAAPASPAPEQKPAPPAQKPKVVKHVVQKGETLFMLSRKYFGNNANVARIARYNGLNAESQLVAGKVVFVPLAP
ncbi:LysM peptidoglycan-binding domain-containing protein [Brevibacillus sp. SAFN-007a]|uniref:LysM peptidoglycan-binding domain-containing protein n=1 Tax=Brevibacillus sp. SAFN-007a TaxID=3436862 RepID=UPI003F8015A2